MVILSRSFAPLIRTGRLAIRQQKNVNPLQQVFGKDVNGTRGLATVFERSKPHVNIGTSSALNMYFSRGINKCRYHWPR